MMNKVDVNALVTALKYSPDSFLEEITYTKEQSELINELINKLIEDNFTTTKEKGDSLEKLIVHIFETHKVFETHVNIYTATNEIDVLLKSTPLGNSINSNIYNSIIKGPLIAECKNYNGTVGVTWIGKFASLLDTSKLGMGLFITKDGITGTHNWDAAKGLIRKISLKRGTLILDFKLSDFKNLEGKNIFDVINNKIDYLNLDMKIEIKKHPGETFFI